MPSAVELIRVSGLASVDYAYAATAPKDARLIFLAGACPLDEHGSTVAPGGLVTQTQQCVTNLQRALASAGATIDDVISTRVLVATTERNDLGTVWTAVRGAFGEHDVPSTLLGVTVLGYPGQLVELEAVAAVVD